MFFAFLYVFVTSLYKLYISSIGKVLMRSFQLQSVMIWYFLMTL